MQLPVGPKYQSPYCPVFVRDAVQHLVLPQNGIPVRDANPAGTLLRITVIGQQPVSPPVVWTRILTAITC
jgi:hypothetical protein